MHASFLPSDGRTIAEWYADDCPLVLVETREERDCWIVGTVELRWDGPDRAWPMTHVREVVARAGDEPSDRERKALADAIARAKRARRRSIRPCAGCGERTPPECGETSNGVFHCHGCMSSLLGVVF